MVVVFVVWVALLMLFGALVMLVNLVFGYVVVDSSGVTIGVVVVVVVGVIVGAIVGGDDIAVMRIADCVVVRCGSGAVVGVVDGSFLHFGVLLCILAIVLSCVLVLLVLLLLMLVLFACMVMVLRVCACVCVLCG